MTSTIGLLIGVPDTVLAVASRPVRLSSLHPGWAEEDPAEWWRNSCSILRQLVAALPKPPHGLAALCVTGMVPALVLLDEAGDVLRPSIQQSDGRAATEVAELAAEMD